MAIMKWEWLHDMIVCWTEFWDCVCCWMSHVIAFYTKIFQVFDLVVYPQMHTSLGCFCPAHYLKIQAPWPELIVMKIICIGFWFQAKIIYKRVSCFMPALYQHYLEENNVCFFLKRLGITFINGNGDNEMRMAARHDSRLDWILGLCLLLNVTCHCFLHKNISGIWFSSISANAHISGLFLSRTLFENTSTLTWTYCHEDNLYRVLIPSKNNLHACFMLYAFMPPPYFGPLLAKPCLNELVKIQIWYKHQ